MNVNINIGLSREDVECLAQSLEICSDENLKEIIERILKSTKETTDELKKTAEAFSKVNPFCMSSIC